MSQDPCDEKKHFQFSVCLNEVFLFSEGKLLGPLSSAHALLHGLFLRTSRHALSFSRFKALLSFFFSIFPPGSVTRSHIFNYLKLNPILAFLQIYYFSLIFLNINICQSQILLASNLIRMHIFPFFPQPSH